MLSKKKILRISILLMLAGGISLFIYKLFQSKKSALEIGKSTKKKRLLIVTTTEMIRDAIINIANDYVEVDALMGPGIDPHSYKAKPHDLRKLNNADIIFYNGLHLEGKMSDILMLMNNIKPTYPVSDALNDTDVMRDKEFSEGVDPHFWFDIQLWKKTVSYISKILQKKLPRNKEIIKKNTEIYLNRLDELIIFASDKLDEIPKKQRVLITAHDAFGYFGRAFNLEVKGLQGISTASEYGLKDVVDLVQFIIKRKIKAIFIETSVPDKPIRGVIERCLSSGHNVILGGPVYSDAMGPRNTLDGTYIGMMKSNINTILRGLKLGKK